MRISDWSSDVCSSDLELQILRAIDRCGHGEARQDAQEGRAALQDFQGPGPGAGRDARFRQDRWVQGRTSEGRGKRYPDRGNCEGRYDLYIGVHATLSSSVHASVHDIEGQVVYSDDGQIEAFSRRSDEHTSELQSLMRNSYAVFCLKKK